MVLHVEKKSIVLLSGGLDSAVAFKKAADAGEVVLALTFDYGQRAAGREIDAAGEICGRFGVPHEVIRLPWLEKITKTALVARDQELPQPVPEALDDADGAASDSAARVWVPNRNGVFINIAAAYAEATGAGLVVAGFNAEEAVTFPDNSPQFVEAINGSLSFSTLKRVEVSSPTSYLNKGEIVRLGLEIDAPLDLLWSCYESGEKMCGSCESCMRLKRGLAEAGSDLAERLFCF